MRVIHKEGPFVPSNPFFICNFHKLVHFDVQGPRLHVWVERDLEQVRTRSAQFLIVPTGADYEPYWKHIQSLTHPNGAVWHLLEEHDPLLDMAGRAWAF